MSIRDLVLTLALSEHESGAPIAITIASKELKSEASKTEGEITAAKRLYQKVDLRNAVVTGGTLHCERENMQANWVHEPRSQQRKRGDGKLLPQPPLVAHHFRVLRPQTRHPLQPRLQQRF